MLVIILVFFYRLSTEVRAKLDDEGKQVEDEIHEDITINPSEDMSMGRKCFNFICGIEHDRIEEENVKSEEELALEASEFLNEEPKYKR